MQGLAMITDHQPLPSMEDELHRGYFTEQDLLQRALEPTSLPLECFTCGDGWVVVL